jgi:hypothetical protein
MSTSIELCGGTAGRARKLRANVSANDSRVPNDDFSSHWV